MDPPGTDGTGRPYTRIKAIRSGRKTDLIFISASLSTLFHGKDIVIAVKM